MFDSYPSALFIEVLESLSLNGLVHSKQVFVCVHSIRLIPVDGELIKHYFIVSFKKMGNINFSKISQLIRIL